MTDEAKRINRANHKADQIVARLAREGYQAASDFMRQLTLACDKNAKVIFKPMGSPGVNIDPEELAEIGDIFMVGLTRVISHAAEIEQ